MFDNLVVLNENILYYEYNAVNVFFVKKMINLLYKCDFSKYIYFSYI
jgi:hypothetical protein